MRILFFFIVFWTGSPILCGESQTITVLFVGNSYTYYNDLPKVVAQLAAERGVDVRVHQSTAAGATFGRQHQEGRVAKLLAAYPEIDVVVLQGQSLEAVRDADAMQRNAGNLVAMIRKHGAQPLFFMTWARKQNPNMIKTISPVYRSLAQDLNTDLAPVGEAWQAAVAHPDCPDLYIADGSHPSPHGSYLAALVILGRLLMQPVQGLSNADLKAVTPSQVRLLQKIAADSLAKTDTP